MGKISLGTIEAKKISFGNNEVKKISFGSIEIWSSGLSGPVGIDKSGGPQTIPINVWTTISPRSVRAGYPDTVINGDGILIPAGLTVVLTAQNTHGGSHNGNAIRLFDLTAGTVIANASGVATATPSVIAVFTPAVDTVVVVQATANSTLSNRTVIAEGSDTFLVVDPLAATTTPYPAQIHKGGSSQTVVASTWELLTEMIPTPEYPVTIMNGLAIVVQGSGNYLIEGRVGYNASLGTQISRCVNQNGIVLSEDLSGTSPSTFSDTVALTKGDLLYLEAYATGGYRTVAASVNNYLRITPV